MDDDGPDDTFTVSMALGYAIAALEILPDDRRHETEDNELAAMHELFGRIIPDQEMRNMYINIARSVLVGEDRPRDRPAVG